MSEIVRKGDFLVFEDEGNVTEFFVSKGSFDLDGCRVGRTGRKLVPNCFGFKIVGSRLPYGHYYAGYSNYWKNVIDSYDGWKKKVIRLILTQWK